MAFTTDSYVVTPIFFPGGDIGKLAVCGTVNDLSMSGARPLFLSAGFIIEEGFPFASLKKIVDLHAKDRCGSGGKNHYRGHQSGQPRGGGSGFSSIRPGSALIPPGIIFPEATPGPGDRVLLSGAIGDHGVAILERPGRAAIFYGPGE